MPHEPVYVIELESNKWYVWRHDQRNIPAIYLIACFYTPWKGGGTPAWVEKYRPLATNPVPTPHPCGSLEDEGLDRFVWSLMLEKGVDNVRGGSFQAIDLTKADAIQLLRKWNRTYEPPSSREIEIESLALLRRMAEKMDSFGSQS
jgi:hypothetical protein